MTKLTRTPFLYHPRYRPPKNLQTTISILLWQTDQVLDPDSDVVTQWQYVFLFTSILALFIDPLYFFLPSVVQQHICMTNDTQLSVVITFFRTVTDLFYLLHMVIKFRTAFVAPTSKVFGRGELVMDPKEIALRYLKTDFVIDLAATLPLPQIVIWGVIPATKTSRTDHANNTLALILLLQYIPRLFLIFPLNQRIIKTTGVVAKTAWAGAAYNLLLYMLASHILGSTWYLMSVGRQLQCWAEECVGLESQFNEGSCDLSYLDCNSVVFPQRQVWRNKTSLWDICHASLGEDRFNFGIFATAVANDVASAVFLEKYLYSLWWGLRNLSSYGQDLVTSTYLGEALFSIFVCILGLVLLAVLIGNIQTYLQSMTVRLEEWRVKKRDTEEWMRHRQLPPDLQERVRRFVQYKWLATKGVNEESILRSLPLDLRREIQRHLCLYLVRRVPFFSQMDDQLLDAICERLVSSLSTQGTFIFREGDPVNEMMFIIRGQLESSTTNGGRSGFFNSITLRPGDFCGEELLTWALMPSSSLHLPTSTRTVRTLTEVEAFSLQAEDLKFVAHQFKHLQSKKLQHAFRYYSHQWRAWGSCYIQAAWRRHKKRKMAEELWRQENLYYMQMSDSTSSFSYQQDYMDGEGYSSSGNNLNNCKQVGGNLASKFSRSTRVPTQKIEVVGSTADSLKMPKLFKPDDSDFGADPDPDV